MFRSLTRREPERRPFVPTADGLARAISTYLGECDRKEAARVAAGGDPASYADAAAQRACVRTIMDEYRAGLCPVCRKPSCDVRPGSTIGASCSRGPLGLD